MPLKSYGLRSGFWPVLAKMILSALPPPHWVLPVGCLAPLSSKKREAERPTRFSLGPLNRAVKGYSFYPLQPFGIERQKPPSYPP